MINVVFSDQSGSDNASIGYGSIGHRESASNSTISSYMSSLRSSESSPVGANTGTLDSTAATPTRSNAFAQHRRSGNSPSRALGSSRGSVANSPYEYDFESNDGDVSLPGLDSPPPGYDPSIAFIPSTGVGRSGKVYGAATSDATDQKLKAVTSQLEKARIHSAAGSTDGPSDKANNDDVDELLAESDRKLNAYLSARKVNDWQTSPSASKRRLSLRRRRASDPAPPSFSELHPDMPTDPSPSQSLQRGSSLTDVAPLATKSNLNSMRGLNSSDGGNGFAQRAHDGSGIFSSRSSMVTDYSIANETDIDMYGGSESILLDNGDEEHGIEDDILIPDDMREFLKERSRLSRQEDRIETPQEEQPVQDINPSVADNPVKQKVRSSSLRRQRRTSVHRQRQSSCHSAERHQISNTGSHQRSLTAPSSPYVYAQPSPAGSCQMLPSPAGPSSQVQASPHPQEIQQAQPNIPPPPKLNISPMATHHQQRTPQPNVACSPHQNQTQYPNNCPPQPHLQTPCQQPPVGHSTPGVSPIPPPYQPVNNLQTTMDNNTHYNQSYSMHHYYHQNHQRHHPVMQGNGVTPQDGYGHVSRQHNQTMYNPYLQHTNESYSRYNNPHGQYSNMANYSSNPGYPPNYDKRNQQWQHGGYQQPVMHGNDHCCNTMANNVHAQKKQQQVQVPHITQSEVPSHRKTSSKHQGAYKCEQPTNNNSTNPCGQQCQSYRNNYEQYLPQMQQQHVHGYQNYHPSHPASYAVHQGPQNYPNHFHPQHSPGCSHVSSTTPDTKRQNEQSSSHQRHQHQHPIHHQPVPLDQTIDTQINSISMENILDNLSSISMETPEASVSGRGPAGAVGGGASQGRKPCAIGAAGKPMLPSGAHDANGMVVNDMNTMLTQLAEEDYCYTRNNVR